MVDERTIFSPSLIDYNMSSHEKTILLWLFRHGDSSPKDISQNQYRENVIRTDCWELERSGLIFNCTEDVFALSETGVSYTESTYGVSGFAGYSPATENQLTDFDEIDPEDIKWRNRRYLTNRDHRYDLNNESRQAVNDSISSVRNSDLNRVMTEFPDAEPLVDQCAHWVRAIAGLHFFPDANHRTAMSTLNTALVLNGIDRIEWAGDRYQIAIFRSKLLRRFSVDVRFDTLWRRDELFQNWRRYFAEQFYDVSQYEYKQPSHKRFEKLLRELD